MSDAAIPAGDGARSERILNAMERTINHDLPNAMVALKGIMQLLLQEEGERLGPAGRDYLARLGGITQRLQTTVTMLRALNKTALAPAAPEKIAIQDLLRETGAAARAGLRGCTLHFHSVLKYLHLLAPQLPLQQAVLELLHLLGEVTDSKDLHYYVASQAAGEEIQLIIGNCPAEPGAGVKGATPPEPGVGPLAAGACNQAGPEQRLRLLLVEEVARSWGGTLSVQCLPGQSFLFTLTFPEQGLHAPGQKGSPDL